MLQSMTGFGRATRQWQDKTFTVEVRTLNSKMMDLNLKLPQEYRAKEIEFRKIVADALVRGKADVYIQVEMQDAVQVPSINRTAAAAYFSEIKSLQEELGVSSPDILRQVLSIPEVYRSQKVEPTTEEFEVLEKTLLTALSETEVFRNLEGEALRIEFTENIGHIGNLLQQIEPFEQERVQTIKDRIQRNLEEKMAEFIDKNRLEQEFIMYIEKLDVSEEKMRLQNHLDYFIETTHLGKDVGKKLGFIAQEIGREINTLGSKSNHAEMQKVVVQMKDYLEKLKEQILNTL